MNVMVIFLFVIPLNVLAQNAQLSMVIKGEVTDDKGEALSGVNISVKGNSKATGQACQISLVI